MNGSQGFVLLDAYMNPILVNAAAAEILVYPEKPNTQQNLGEYLAGKIGSTLFSEPQTESAHIIRFQSGRRQYLCRTFRVNGTAHEDCGPSFALILERASARSTSQLQLLEKFHLSNREQEVALFLLQGLTSKEIGMRMQISPNTVKAFLRLIMVKMGVSTRSGIVGKALTTEL